MLGPVQLIMHFKIEIFFVNFKNFFNFRQRLKNELHNKDEQGCPPEKTSLLKMVI